MKTRFTQWSLIGLLLLGMLFVHTETTMAVSGNAVWNSDSSVSSLTLVRGAYKRKPGYSHPDFRAIAYDTTKITGWAPAINGIHASVYYTAEVKQDGDRVRGYGSLVDGRMLPTVFVGKTISFTSLSPQNGAGEISWFGAGYSLDSPYGIWRENATAPDIVDEDAFLKNQTVVADYNGPGGAARTITWKSYIPLSVHPPTITYDHIGSTAGLDCNPTGDSCLVTSPGEIFTHVNYSATYGKFYSKYQSTNAVTTFGYTGYNTQPNAYTKVPLRRGWGNCAVNGYRQWCDHVATEDYRLEIPSQTIEFNLNAIVEPPLGPIPTLSVTPAVNPVNTDFVFTARGQGSTPDARIRYEFELDNFGIGYFSFPSLPDLPPGTPAVRTRQFVNPGTRTLRVRTIDEYGAISAWSDPVSLVVAPAPTATFTINGNPGPSMEINGGDIRKFEWSSTNATYCDAASGDVWAGRKAPASDPGGEELVASIPTNHTLTCTGPGGSVTKNIDVTLKCTPTTGTFGSCDCETELKSRVDVLANCDTSTEKKACDADEKKACRNFNWIETNP